MWNAFKFLPNIRRIKNSKRINRFVTWVRQNWKRESAFAVFGNFLNYTFIFFGIINADGVKLKFIGWCQKCSHFG